MHRTLVLILPFFSRITPVGVIDMGIAGIVTGIAVIAGIVAGIAVIAGIIMIDPIVVIAGIVPLVPRCPHRLRRLLSVRGDKDAGHKHFGSINLPKNVY
ncbi:MAG: hypothetical protein ACYDGO_06850 [Smithellaceae bacterium]